MFVDWRYVYARITYGSTYGSFNKGFKYLKQEVIQSNSIRMNQISDSIDLAKRTISDKTLKDKVYEIARNPNGYQTPDRYQTGLACSIPFLTTQEHREQVQMKSQPKNYINQKKLKNSKEGESMRNLNIIFGQQMQLK